MARSCFLCFFFSFVCFPPKTKKHSNNSNNNNNNNNKTQQRPRHDNPHHRPARRPGQRRQRRSRSRFRSRFSRRRRCCSSCWHGQRRPQAGSRRRPLPGAGARRGRRRLGGRQSPSLRLRPRHLPRRLAPRRLLPRRHEPQAARDRRVRRRQQHLLQHFHVRMEWRVEEKRVERERKVFLVSLQFFFYFASVFLSRSFSPALLPPHPPSLSLLPSGTPPATATCPSSASRSTPGSSAGSTRSPSRSTRPSGCRCGWRTRSTRRAP